MTQSDSVRVGLIDGINDSNGTVRVTFPDRDDEVIEEIALLNFEEKYPKVGDSVICIFTDDGGSGFCLGTYFNNELVPVKNRDTYVKKIDELIIQYDYNSKKLSLSPLNGVTIDCDIVINGNLTVTGQVISS